MMAIGLFAIPLFLNAITQRSNQQTATAAVQQVRPTPTPRPTVKPTPKVMPTPYRGR